MKVLFLGGTGNISTACVSLAVERGHEVTVLNRGRTASRVRGPVRVAVGERDDPARLRALAEETRFDAVVDFLAFRPEQVDAAVGAFAGRAGQYVFIGTTAAYEKPVRRHVLTEATPLANPFWEYARLKIACEERVWRAHREGLPCTVLRPSYTYGETWIPSGFGGQDYTVVDHMRRGLPIVCHGDGTSLWVMTAASDFAVGLVGLLGQRAALGEAFHATSDEVLTWDAIYRTIAEAAGARLEMVHVPSETIAALYPERGGSLLGDKAWSVVFDNAKLRAVVPDYRPRVSFAEGMARSIAWLDADPSRRVVNEEMGRRIDRLVALQRRAAAG
jgi:nucleoside-diphosphate-sugar epimerase